MSNDIPNSRNQVSKDDSSAPVRNKKVEKAIDGNIKIKKKNEIRKFADVFLSDDIGDIKSYILSEVLIPAAKKAIDDIFANGIKMLRMLLWGEKDEPSKRHTASRISYRDYYAEKDDRECNRTTVKSWYSYDDIVFDNRGEAEEVLARMDELISMYDIASVADLYDLCGVSGNYTDNKYGWTDIHNASIIRVRDGYLLKLPRARALPLN